MRLGDLEVAFVSVISKDSFRFHCLLVFLAVVAVVNTRRVSGDERDGRRGGVDLAGLDLLPTCTYIVSLPGFGEEGQWQRIGFVLDFEACLRGRERVLGQ